MIMSMMKCEICQDLIFRNSNSQKYCKRCAKMIHKMQKSIRDKLLTEKKHDKLQKLGTSVFSPHKCNDFNIEYIMIQKELKKLGIKRQFT